MAEKLKLLSVCINSGAEITVWPPELEPETPTEQSEESRSGVRYFGPGDKNGPTLVNHGRGRYTIQFVTCWQLPTMCISRLKEAGLNIARLAMTRWEVRGRRGGAAPVSVGKRVGASFAVSPIEGAGMPPREGAQDASQDGEQLRQHQAPGMPTAAERARHEVDHCPYQAWCRSSVAGRGKANAHFRRESEEDGVFVRCYEFMREKLEDDRMSDKCLPIVLHKFYKDRDEWAAKVATHDILLSGLKGFCHKSASERSIVALKHEVARRLRRDEGPIGVQFEESGVGESQGNAVVERAIKEIESMTRTLVHAAREFHGATVIHPRLPLSFESWRCPERARRGARHGRQ